MGCTSLFRARALNSPGARYFQHHCAKPKFNYTHQRLMELPFLTNFSHPLPLKYLRKIIHASVQFFPRASRRARIIDRHSSARSRFSKFIALPRSLARVLRFAFAPEHINNASKSDRHSYMRYVYGKSFCAERSGATLNVGYD